MIKVSVIVPIYNSEKYLEKCLDSLVNQTLKDIEIILINDGSTDSSKDIILKYKEQYNNIILIDKQNEGIGKARNDGIKKASGEYITFVDSDDYIKINMFEDFYNYSKKHEMDMVTGTYYKVKNGKESIFKYSKFKTGNIKTSPSILFSIEYGPCAKFYKRKMIIENNILFEENKKYEDFPFVSKCLLKSKLIGQITESYYYYVIHENSETTTMDSKVFDIFHALDVIREYYKREFYLKDEIDYLIIDKATNYMLQQRVQKNKKIKKDFIDYGYNYLNKNVKNWKNNKYYKKTSFIKRIIKNNKNILKGYCNIYGIFKRI